MTGGGGATRRRGPRSSTPAWNSPPSRAWRGSRCATSAPGWACGRQSLYSYFSSKDGIYDAMFAEGQRQLAVRMEAVFGRADREGMTTELFLAGSRDFFDFCVESPVRYQLLFQRTIPGFEPSPESYEPAVRGLERTREALAGLGLDRPEDLDLYTALMTGLTDQQISNDPGGDRWGRLLDEAVQMFLDHRITDQGTTGARRGRNP
ncbi:MAG: TetR/AcrR family transcriptional regulator [Acidimicrobiia bacterium]|nr:TetR/AcrR family transcriptional regulator [Acidimicrobiia bacterium]